MTSGSDTARTSWDLFCRVVDHYGDIGIAWRLARQLAADPRRSVRLFVDGFDAFARIEPRVAGDRDRQTIDGIDIARWPADDAGFESVAAVVIELLGGGLPPGYLDAMTRHVERGDTPPVWIDYEHLSAEPWVADFHRMPSPHPRRPLVKHFFYPGFGPRIGGLLVEPDLADRRAAFVADPRAAAALWRDLGVAPPVDGEVRMSLYAYEHAPVDALLATLAGMRERRWSIVVPDGVARAAIERFFAAAGAARGRVRTHDALTVTTVPFVDQATYDALLWACDINFVRGEDSFVRAQAAGRPFVWQIYRQPEDAHRAKLHAFETLYEDGLPSSAVTAQRALWDAWNAPSGDVGPALRTWLAVQPALRTQAERWRAQRSAEAPLIDRLVAFVAAPGPPSATADLLD